MRNKQGKQIRIKTTKNNEEVVWLLMGGQIQSGLL